VSHAAPAPAPRTRAASAAPPPPPPTGRAEWRRVVSQQLLPTLRAFGPDLILLSMGFDACRGDVGCSRPDPLTRVSTSGLDLEAADIIWFTPQVMAVAAYTCNGRVVSVLEGGYGAWDGRGLSAGETVTEINVDPLVANVCAHSGSLTGRTWQN